MYSIARLRISLESKWIVRSVNIQKEFVKLFEDNKMVSDIIYKSFSHLRYCWKSLIFSDSRINAFGLESKSGRWGAHGSWTTPALDEECFEEPIQDGQRSPQPAGLLQYLLLLLLQVSRSPHIRIAWVCFLGGRRMLWSMNIGVAKLSKMRIILCKYRDAQISK